MTDVPDSTTQTLAPVAGSDVVAGRSPWRIAWVRLRRDRVALAGGIVVVLLVLVAIFAPLIVLTLWMGIYPQSFLSFFEATVANLVSRHEAALGAARLAGM